MSIWHEDDIPPDLKHLFEPAPQIGLEATPDAYVAKMVDVFAEVRRVLREDGTLWLNLGDSYASTTNGSGGPDSSSTLVGTPAEGNGQRFPARRVDIGAAKPKDLMMMPWRVALALQADGWYLRSVIVWAKKSPMPESVTDRPTSSWEPIFLMSKSPTYFYDAEAIKEPSTYPDDNRKARQSPDDYKSMVGDGGQVRAVINPANAKTYPTRNSRNVWHLGPESFAGCHFATFPTEIPRRAIKAGTSEKGCCPKCLAPWVRQVERTQLKRERPNDYTKRDGEEGTGNSCANSVAGVATKTTGWLPSCECGETGTRPCVVLEPFLGSGTTLAVAAHLGRHGCGIELNPEYVKLARDRIGMSEKPNTHRSERAEDAPLFGAGG